MNDAGHKVMFYQFLTPAHPGSGQARGHIDRCIQRNGITGYPFIQWRSVKGSLRAMMRCDNSIPDLSDEDTKNLLFGKSEQNASPLLISDAYPLFFPAPVLKGLYLYFTSPEILKTYSDLANEDPFPCPDGMTPSAYICFNDPTHSTKKTYSINGNIFVGSSIVLSEFKEKNNDLVTAIKKKILNRMDERLKKEIEERFVVVSPETLRHITLKCVEVRPNIKIKENGITEDGSLRFTEYLPEKTILFSRIDTGYIDFSVSKAEELDQASILKTFKDTIEENQSKQSILFRFGGEEGGCMGKCRLSFRGEVIG